MVPRDLIECLQVSLRVNHKNFIGVGFIDTTIYLTVFTGVDRDERIKTNKKRSTLNLAWREHKR
jgi:hypothetical protein